MNDSASLWIKVTPKSRSNAIKGWESEVLKVHIQAPAEKGEANRELIRFFSKLLKIPQRNIILEKGSTARLKKIVFEGITQEELVRRLKMASANR